jgi:phosphoserine aminotransferase
MNVVFRLPQDKEEALEKPFLEGAKKAGLSGLKGHRLVGGFRASIYNAHPVEGVQALAAYLKDFERRNG